MKGPTSVAVDAGSNSWMFYSKGKIKQCGTSVNHAVLLTGYNAKVWFAKNSWGTGWGLSGHLKLAIGNTCGVCMYGGEVVTAA